jgi:hypothetical protein
MGFGAGVIESGIQHGSVIAGVQSRGSILLHVNIPISSPLLGFGTRTRGKSHIALIIENVTCIL